jgi:hypothetical protein
MKYLLFQSFPLISICCFSGGKAHSTFGKNYLQATKINSLPGVKGRIKNKYRN